MKLIVGLGNPTQEYANTRHNAGFMAIDEYAKSINADFKLEAKFKGMISLVTVKGHKAILLKPVTYMNLSGESVREVLRFYKIAKEDMLVISDDLDSKVGRVRLRASGSSGGHNGLKNISLHTGGDDFKRMKIGIDRSKVISVIDWVLQKFSEDDLALMNQAFVKTSKAIEDFICDVDFVKIASLYSSK